MATREIFWVAEEAATNHILWTGEKVPITTDYAIGKELHLTHDDRFEGLPQVTIRIEKQLSIRENKESQALLVKILSPSASSGEHPSDLKAGRLPDEVVAKVWDEGHYSYRDPVDGRPLPTSLEERSFIEAHAYTQLEPLQGTYLPKFYGYYFFHPEGEKGRRVNVVLLEYIRGISPLDMEECGSHSMGDIKYDVINETLRCLNEIHSLGVFHYQVGFQNFLLSFNGDRTSLSRVSLIDFQNARFRWKKLPENLVRMAREFDIKCLERQLQSGRFMKTKFSTELRAFPEGGIEVPIT